MSKSTTRLPNPSNETVMRWLRSLTREYLHKNGWQEINQRFHPIARSARAFINENYADPNEREAVFDGLTLGLLVMMHFDDINQLTALYGQSLSRPRDANSGDGA